MWIHHTYTNKLHHEEHQAMVGDKYYSLRAKEQKKQSRQNYVQNKKPCIGRQSTDHNAKRIVIIILEIPKNKSLLSYRFTCICAHSHTHTHTSTQQPVGFEFSSRTLHICSYIHHTDVSGTNSLSQLLIQKNIIL